MNGFEFNKIAAAVLLGGIAMLAADIFAHDVYARLHLETDKRAYSVLEGYDPSAAQAPVQEEKKQAEPILALLERASVDDGAIVARRCGACHGFDEGGGNRVGPNLWNIINADFAHLSDFAYSSALAEKEGKWTYDALNKFLYNPKEYVVGTKMNFAGIAKPEERAAVIKYMRAQSNNPAPLPTEAEIAAESGDAPADTPEASEEPNEEQPQDSAATVDAE